MARARDLNLIAEYHRSRVTGRPSASLDDRTWSDLDMDAVFASIDRTESTLGQQALYHRLRSAPVADHADAFEALVTRLAGDGALRERIRRVLARLQHPYGYDLWWLAQPDAIQQRPWHIIFPCISALAVASMWAIPFWHGAVLLLIAIGVINLLMRITTVRRIAPLAGPFRQLSALIGAGDALRELQGADIDPLVACLRDDVTPLQRLRRIAFWVGRDSMAIGDQANSFYEYLNLFFLLDATTMFFGARELRAHGVALLRVIGAVGDVDAAMSVAALRADLQEGATWTRPRVLPPPDPAPATFADLRHPLIDAARAVPNSIALAAGRGVLITGSNMSGKSTFLRTIGVNTVLAQTIHTCFASRYEAPVFHVRSCIGRADDLLAGKSYYIAEVEAVLALVRASESASPHLFLFDELFRGTNATERIAAAESVLRELIDHGRPHAIVTSTHDAELVDLLRDTHDAYHFPDTLGPDGLVFTYRLEPGPSPTRNAIALLQLHGAPPALIARALRRAEALDQRVRE